MTGRRGALADFRRASTAIGMPATFPPSRARRICPSTCGSARCRSGNSPGTHTRARCSPAATARRHGCRELDLARFLRADPLAPPARRRRRASSREYDALAFRNDPRHFAAWCEGATGYPIVDAAMRQINATGYMHNRLRMIVAWFLVKDLLVDWRWGERYFADTLHRLRPRVEQRRLAVGGVDRLRRAAVLPDLQSGRAVGALRSRGQVHPALRAGAAALARRDPRAVAASRPRSSRRRAWWSAATIPRRSSITRSLATTRSRCSRPRGLHRKAD